MGVATRFAIPAVIIYWLLVLTGSLWFIGVMWIPMDGCSPEWADFVGGRWCGLGRLPHFWCGLGPAGCGGGFRGDDGCTPSMGLSVDTEFSSVVRDSDCPLVWVAQKPCGGSAGPRSAGAYIGDVVLPVTAWPACRLRWTALIGQLPMGVHGSRGF